MKILKSIGKAIGHFFLTIWRMMSDYCTLCGGKLNVVYGFGPSHSARLDGTYKWCPSCHMGCRSCAAEDRREVAKQGRCTEYEPYGQLNGVQVCARELPCEKHGG